MATNKSKTLSKTFKSADIKRRKALQSRDGSNAYSSNEDSDFMTPSGRVLKKFKQDPPSHYATADTNPPERQRHYDTCVCKYCQKAAGFNHEYNAWDRNWEKQAKAKLNNSLGLMSKIIELDSALDAIKQYHTFMHKGTDRYNISVIYNDFNKRLNNLSSRTTHTVQECEDSDNYDSFLNSLKQKADQAIVKLNKYFNQLEKL